MKNGIISLISLISLFLLVSLSVFALASCNQPADSESESSEGETALDPNDPWSSAIYTENKEFGEGAKTCTVLVTVGDHNVTFTLHTDEEYLGAALLAHELITGEEGAYGLYVKTVNGILADYDVDQTYWALYVDGNYASSGVDSTPIEAGRVYRLSKDKG